MDHTIFLNPTGRKQVVMESYDSTILDTTVDEWRAEMDSFYGDDPGKTTKELAEEFNVSVRTMQRRIATLIDFGRCKKGRALRDFRGFPRYTSVYQLILKKKAGKQ